MVNHITENNIIYLSDNCHAIVISPIGNCNLNRETTLELLICWWDSNLETQVKLSVRLNPVAQNELIESVQNDCPVIAIKLLQYHILTKLKSNCTFSRRKLTFCKDGASFLSMNQTISGLRFSLVQVLSQLINTDSTIESVNKTLGYQVNPELLGIEVM
jgi:hypothetical protein